MVLRFFLLTGVFLFMSCTEFERDHPDDPGGSNYRGAKLITPSSSSVYAESSSVVVSSSSSVQNNSSSSSTASLSSSVLSSSSVAVSSSSSSEFYSSNAMSSSSGVLCRTAANNTSTQYCSNGIMKEYGFVTLGEQTYKTVEIGTQIWMAENLNYDVPGSVCYNNNSANCKKYGRLYDWAAAMNLPASYNTNTYATSGKHRGICPEDWHIPSGITSGEWNILMTTTVVGGWFTSGDKHLKAIEWGGEDTYGFAALPGGGYDGYMAGSLIEIGTYGSWWSEYNGANFAYLVYNGNRWDTDSKSGLHSVRCVKD